MGKKCLLNWTNSEISDNFGTSDEDMKVCNTCPCLTQDGNGFITCQKILDMIEEEMR